MSLAQGFLPSHCGGSTRQYLTEVKRVIHAEPRGFLRRGQGFGSAVAERLREQNVHKRGFIEPARQQTVTRCASSSP